jgi:hypothetical protein
MESDVRKGVRMREQENGQKEKVLSPDERRELQEMGRKVKGLYLQFLRLANRLDIPFVS